MQAVTITQISPTEFDERIQNAVDRAIEKRESKNNNTQIINQEEYVPLDEAAKRLHVDKSTLHNWRKKGIVRGWQIGNRVYLKWSEVEASIQPLK